MQRDTFGVGLFLPMANGGWIISHDSPRFDGSYAYNRRVARIAEDAGFDFAIAMAKWRGYGGATRHWDYTIDSLSMCCGLAEATNRMDLYCTIHTTVFHPVPVAKMMATFDQIAGGRAGMNIVAKAYNPEIAQMGIAPIDEARRYDYAREWLTVIKRLWTEARVDFQGDFFRIDDCVSDPKPLRTPRPPLICAGISDIGRRFTIEEADGCLISANDQESLKERSRHVKRLAEQLGRSTNTIALVMVVPGSTTAEAQARVDRYNRAADLEALQTVARSFGVMNSASQIKQLALDGKAVGMMSGYPLAGDAQTVVALLTDLFEDGELDGVVLTVPDFIDDLEWLGEKVMPALEQRGFTRRQELRPLSRP
jgi:pyrimidine oxygenase